MSGLRFAGALLLAGACAGCGAALAAHKRAAWRQVHTFCALLDLFYGGIRYQAQPCAALLAQAAADARFAALGLDACADFAAVPVPAALGPELAAQAAQTLAALGAAPRQRACTALARLLEQCRGRARELNALAGDAMRLYPRLGLCAGLLLVLLLL